MKEKRAEGRELSKEIKVEEHKSQTEKARWIQPMMGVHTENLWH